MNGIYSRMVGWGLLGVAMVVLTLALDLRDANGSAEQAVLSLQQQVLKARSTALTKPQPQAIANATTSSEQASAWRVAAKSLGSNARNTAALLQRTKEFCAASGLTECQIRRSSLRASGTATGGLLVPHPVNVLARFSAAGVEGFSKQLAKSGLLYRIERVNIVQNRAEWDVIFFVLSESSAQP